jgi:hypothetical protein
MLRTKPERASACSWCAFKNLSEITRDSLVWRMTLSGHYAITISSDSSETIDELPREKHILIDTLNFAGSI